MSKIILLAMLALVLVTGCSQTEGRTSNTSTDASPVEASPTTEATTPAPVIDTPEPTPTPERPAYGEFGGVGFTYDNGITITLSAPAAYEPSDSAFAEGDFDAYVSFDVTITNDSVDPFDPSGLYATMSSGGREAVQSFDSELGLAGQPQTQVLPGRSVTWSEGWGVADPADLTYQIAPSFEYEAALFVGGM